MGPTACGKTRIAVELAASGPFEIISVDSALVYRGLDIGSGKPDQATQARAPHRLIDIREIDADVLLSSGCAGDLALALLARGGTERLAEIAERAEGLSDRERSRVMVQLVVLSGLRGLSEQVKMEMKAMGSLQFKIRDNVILREVWDTVMSEGLAKGEARGEAKGEAKGETVGMVKILRTMLQTKFGRVPKWADQRLEKANKTQIERWSKKFVAAETLEAVIGKK